MKNKGLSANLSDRCSLFFYGTKLPQKKCKNKLFVHTEDSQKKIKSQLRQIKRIQKK